MSLACSGKWSEVKVCASKYACVREFFLPAISFFKYTDKEKKQMISGDKNDFLGTLNE